MAFVQRIKIGLHVAQHSFVTLWHHKILIIYPLLAMLTFAVAQLLVSDAYSTYQIKTPATIKVVTQGHALSTGIHANFMANLLERSHYGVIFLLFYIYALVTIFFAYIFIHHLFAYLDHRTTSITTEINHGAKKIVPLSIWAIIIAITHFISLLIPLTYSIKYTQTAGSSELEANIINTFKPLNIMVQIILLVWIFFTMLVIPLLAKNNNSLWQTIGQSARLVKNRFIEIISGGLVYITLGILFMFPVLLLMQAYIDSLLFLAITLPLSCINMAAFTLFTGLLVHGDGKKHDAMYGFNAR